MLKLKKSTHKSRIFWHGLREAIMATKFNITCFTVHTIILGKYDRYLLDGYINQSNDWWLWWFDCSHNDDVDITHLRSWQPNGHGRHKVSMEGSIASIESIYCPKTASPNGRLGRIWIGAESLLLSEFVQLISADGTILWMPSLSLILPWRLSAGCGSWEWCHWIEW